MDYRKDLADNKFLEIKELAKYLNVKVNTIYSWVHQGKIPHVKINGLIRFDLEKINYWIGDNFSGIDERVQ